MTTKCQKKNIYTPNDLDKEILLEYLLLRMCVSDRSNKCVKNNNINVLS